MTLELSAPARANRPAGAPGGAELLAVVADPVRWRLLAEMAGGSRCVCALQPVAAVSAPALSHHLRVLREAGLVSSARRGRWIDYTLAPDAGDRVRAALPFLPLPTGTSARETCAEGGAGRR